MEARLEAEARKESTRRRAMITSVCTFALCPIECVCVSRTDPEQKQVKCGHYRGSVTDVNGSFVKCEYRGER